MDAWLEKEDGSCIAIADGFSIGRGTENQLALFDERASRRHALIHDRGKDGFWIVDLGSRNGTYRNSQRVQQPSRLRDGDLVRVGSTQFTFRQPGADGPLSSVAPTVNQTILEVRSEDCWLLIGDLVGSTQFVQKLDPGQASVLTAQWLQQCRKLIETSGGMINKFLGDGFLAYWRAAGTEVSRIAPCLDSLRQMQGKAEPRFRLVLHRGRVHFGGGASLGEENMSGPELNFAFRMEKLAGSIGVDFLLSEAAAAHCKERWSLDETGGHSLQGFEGAFRFFRF